MPDDNTTNLPILDDIIKPGNTDKAEHRPPSKAQSSIRRDDETSEPSSTSVYAETDSDTAVDEPVHENVRGEAGQAQQSPMDLPDIDTLTEEILGSMMPEMEQLLREKIQQALVKKFSGETEPD